MPPVKPLVFSVDGPVRCYENIRVTFNSKRAKPDDPYTGEKVFDVVDEMPTFPGGAKGLYEYLARAIKYPVVAEENGIQGRVICTFVVEPDGSITNVRVVKSIDPSLDKEARRVLKNMPNWNPGKHYGKEVRVKYTVPVTFRLGQPNPMIPKQTNN
jgi:protein TonB